MTKSMLLRAAQFAVTLPLLAAAAIAVAEEKEGAQDWFDQANAAAARGESAKAVEALNKVIAELPNSSQAYYLRGREHFRLGKIKESVADFDKMVALDPKSEAPLWERGISLYFAGEYERGAKQFELYQTYLNNDVENATWRFLCLAKKDGLEKARKTLLPIEGDTRVPMKEIYKLYRGELEAKDVMAVTEEAAGGIGEKKSPYFYAHLYIGLLADVNGDKKLARKNFEAAAGKYRINHYMGDVARICLERLEPAKE